MSGWVAEPSGATGRRRRHRTLANIRKKKATPAITAIPRQISRMVTTFMSDDAPGPSVQLPATATSFENAALAIRHTIGSDLARRKLVRLATHGAAGTTLG